jgi:hypothetical protein
MGKYKGRARLDKERKRGEGWVRQQAHLNLSLKEKVEKSASRRGYSIKETIRNLYPIKGDNKERALILRTRVAIVAVLHEALAKGDDVWQALYYNALHHPQDWDKLDGSHLKSVKP